MILKIFLDDKGFHRLKQSVPAASPSKLSIKSALHLKFFGGNTVVSCDEAEAGIWVICRPLPERDRFDTRRVSLCRLAAGPGVSTTVGGLIFVSTHCIRSGRDNMSETKCVCGEATVANLATCGRLKCDQVVRSFKYQEQTQVEKPWNRMSVLLKLMLERKKKTQRYE
jgi:hypothetical protein